MRLIISLIFVAVFTSAVVARERSLAGIYDTMLWAFKSKGDDPRINPFKNTNLECLKQRLKLAEFGSKTVDEDFGLLASIAGAFLCSDDQNAAYGASLNQIVDNVATIDNVECYKRRLLELEPSSELVKDFSANPTVTCESPLFAPSRLQSIHKDRLSTFTRLNLLKCVNTELKESELTEIKESLLKVMSRESGGIPENIKQAMFAEMKKEHADVFKCCMEELEK